MLYGRRYWKEYALWFVVFVGALQAAYLWAADLPQGHLLRWAALLPVAVATAGGIWVELRNLARLDELERLIYLEAMTVAGFFIMSWNAALLLMESLVGLPRPSAAWNLGVMGLGFCVGFLIAKRRHT